MAAGIVSKQSPYSVGETLDRLEAILNEKGITVFARIDHAAGAAEAGLTLRSTQVLVFGNPKAGTPVMQANQQAAIDLPLKALAWEDETGQVWLGMNDPDVLAKRFGLAPVLLSGLAGSLALLDAVVKG